MKESLLVEVFWHAGFFLVLSALIIPILRYLKIPPALGYLLAGIALGPQGIATFTDHSAVMGLTSLQDSAHIKILAELGIVLLLFVVGLELTPRRLWQMRSLVFGLGGAQVIISASVIGGIAYYWGNNIQVSVLLGLGLALSSTAIVTQWLHEKKLFVTHAGRASFSILLLQDLAVIPILLLLTILSAETDGGVLEFAATSLVKMSITALIIYFGGRVVLKPLFSFANRHGGAEVFMALSLLVIVASASVAALAGLSMALGAFIAGLLLADTEYRHEISSLVIPFKSMLLGIFFLSFGMGIDLSFIAEKPFWLFSSVIGLVIIKAAIIYGLCRLWGQSNAVSVESAILLAQAGEFGLLVVSGAMAGGLMDESVSQFMLLNVGITMMLAPLMAPLARQAGMYLENKDREDGSLSAQKPDEDTAHHAVILGFGRVGKAVANDLSGEGFEILGFDSNVDIVSRARKTCSPVYLGDVTRRATLNAAQIEKAACIIITIGDIETTREIVKKAREICKNTPIVVRAHNQGEVEFFENTPHIEALSEDRVLGQSLSDTVLKLMGANSTDDASEKLVEAAE